VNIPKRTFPRDNHVNAIVAQAEAKRAAYRQSWDEPVLVSGHALNALNGGDWVFLNANNIFLEESANDPTVR
jgi:hypothetical protein